MLWIAKDLCASKDDPNKAQNPFVIGKLDLTSIENFNFKSYQNYIDTGDNLG